MLTERVQVEVEVIEDIDPVGQVRSLLNSSLPVSGLAVAPSRLTDKLLSANRPIKRAAATVAATGLLKRSGEGGGIMKGWGGGWWGYKTRQPAASPMFI